MSSAIRAEPILLPRIRWPSFAIAPGSIDAVTPAAGMPTITIVPPRRRSDAPCSTTPGAPTVTMTWSTPAPPVRAATAFVTLSLPEPTACGRAEGERRLELVRRDVDRDHCRGAGDHGSLDGVEPDPSGADHDDALARSDGGRVDDGAEAGDHAAGEQGGAVEWDVARDHDRLRGVDDDLLGEGRSAKPLQDRAPVGRRQRAVLVEPECRLAERRLPLMHGPQPPQDRISVTTT